MFECAFQCFQVKGKGVICGSRLKNKQMTEIGPRCSVQLWPDRPLCLCVQSACVCWLGWSSWAGSDRKSLRSPMLCSSPGALDSSRAWKPPKIHRRLNISGIFEGWFCGPPF